MKKRLLNKGVVLVTGMMLLLILTMIEITAMGSTALEEKMTQNLRDMSAAFNATEASLVDAEQWLYAQGVPPASVSACSATPCRVWSIGSMTTPPYQQSASWWQTNGTAFSSTISGVNAQPRYVIEVYSFAPDDLSTGALSTGKGAYYYRITAQGVGATPKAVVNLQSIYAVRFN